LKESTPSTCQGRASCLRYQHVILLAGESAQGSGQLCRVYKVEDAVNWRTPVLREHGIVLSLVMLAVNKSNRSEYPT